MTIQLNQQQLRALDNQGDRLQRVIDPRTNTAYVLVPELDYEEMRELLEDERRQQAIHAAALRAAADRLNEGP